MLKWILEKWDVSVWTGINWLKTGSNGRLSRIRWCTFRFHNAGTFTDWLQHEVKL